MFIYNLFIVNHIFFTKLIAVHSGMVFTTKDKCDSV